MAKANKMSAKNTIKPGKNIVTPMVEGIKEQLMSLMDKGIKDITIDFSNIEDIDSNGLGLLIAANNSLKGANGRLKIKNISGRMNKFMRTTHLDKYFDVVEQG
ncbi:MAG: STAS domain-containing protein [Deltaproteobacteria bacterium]|nr:STAS domain-containing protein [Deltaproteobacteria bacterium]